jgi:hypothetical protein
MNILKSFLSALVLVFTVYCGGAQAGNELYYYQNCYMGSKHKPVYLRVCNNSQAARFYLCNNLGGQLSGSKTMCGTGKNCKGCTG